MIALGIRHREWRVDKTLNRPKRFLEEIFLCRIHLVLSNFPSLIFQLEHRVSSAALLQHEVPECRSSSYSAIHCIKVTAGRLD
ncbi:hypothetical protein SAMN05192563_103935 [Paraburkholderia aspalathi]|uniref:Uncharacterized protein n=1 Tax=Paraburkholderia aspalathi TaxID=1324617 RepID=A0A1I7ENZ2_9BURK|nr:hypothetical protein SAMN05192563_103935 [Paraburkholderia aspalathi]